MGCKRQVGQRLQRGEVRARDRCASLFVDVDREIRGDVLGPWRAVVIDDHVVPEHLLDGIAATYRPGAARKRGVSQQWVRLAGSTYVDYVASRNAS